MFIKPKGYLISQVSFHPNLQNLNNNFPTNCSLSEKVVEWVKKVLQEPDLTVEELLAYKRIFLLNILNIIVPSKVNKVLRTTVEKKQEIQNLNEYMQTLKNLEYTKMNKISPQDLIVREPKMEKRILKSLMFLKTRYEEMGNLKEFSKSTRTFYILIPKDPTENENKYKEHFQMKQNIDLNSENYLKTELINPYLVSENCDLSENSWEFENIFFMGNEKMLSILKEKRIELRDLFSGDETSDFSDDYFSTDDLSDNGWNLVGFKKEKELECVWVKNPIPSENKEFETKSKKENENKNENEKGWKKKTEKEKENENEKDIEKEKEKENEKDIEKDIEKEKEKEIEKEIEIKNKIGYGNKIKIGTKIEKEKITEKEMKIKKKSIRSLDFNQNEVNEEDNRRNIKEKIHLFSSSADPNTYDSETSDSEYEGDSKHEISEPPTPRQEFEKNNNLKDNIKLLPNEDLYESIDLYNPKNDYIKTDLEGLFKLKNRSQNSIYIVTLFFLLNKFNGWKSNNFQNSINFIKELTIKRYDQLIENAFANCEDLIKIGHAKFLIRFQIMNQEGGMLYDKDGKKMDDDDDDDELENKEPNIINNKKNKGKGQKNNEDEKNILINNGYIELTKKKIYVYKNTITRILYKIKSKNQIKLKINKIYLNKLILIFMDKKRQIKTNVQLIFNSEIERLNFLTIIISFLQKKSQYLQNGNNVKSGKYKNKKNHKGQKGNNNDDDDDDDDDDYEDNSRKKGWMAKKNIQSDLPLLKPPNKHFLKKMSSMDQIKDQSNLKQSLQSFYENSGVNYLIRVLEVPDNKSNNGKSINTSQNKNQQRVSKKSEILKNGYIEIRKAGLIVGIENSTVEKIQFKNSPLVFKFPKNRVKFNIQWNNTRSCRVVKESSITFVCQGTSERSLIMKSIYYFFRMWKKNKKNKKFWSIKK
ncbi:protein stay-green 1 -related [Anaeramoeba flamelloides]|uniref:Protein stay-green 1 -related n=1 Tax=Anaeramoeba flamelloides TaxID=1746091 RepID=A0AAV7ZLJ9_9EUKA|nr:protein stay-green 1 -related [Anaeramoeba flamelloides]